MAKISLVLSKIVYFLSSSLPLSLQAYEEESLKSVTFFLAPSVKGNLSKWYTMAV